MKKFEFRLQTVLRWRNTQLQLERVRLQKLLNEEQKLKRDLQALEEERKAVLSGVQSAKQWQAFDLRAVSAYLLGADARAGLLQQQIAGCAMPIQQQRQHLLEAERKVRLLEKLREDRYAGWKKSFDQEIEWIAEESWLAAHFRESQLQSGK